MIAGLQAVELICRPVPAPITINGFLNEWGDIKLPVDQLRLDDPGTNRPEHLRNKSWAHFYWDS